VARPGRFRQLCLNSIFGQKLSGLINQAPPRVSTGPRIRVVNQQGVVKSHIHGSSTEEWPFFIPASLIRRTAILSGNALHGSRQSAALPKFHNHFG
jgi:hypothetical protein